MPIEISPAEKERRRQLWLKLKEAAGALLNELNDKELAITLDGHLILAKFQYSTSAPTVRITSGPRPEDFKGNFNETIFFTISEIKELLRNKIASNTQWDPNTQREVTEYFNGLGVRF